MSSFARLSAALGTAAVLATAGLGLAYADTSPSTATTPATYDIGTSSGVPQQPAGLGTPAATPTPPPPLAYDLKTSSEAPAGTTPVATPTSPPPLTYDLKTSSEAPQQPEAAQPTPSSTAQQTTLLAEFQGAFSNLLPTLGDGTHTDPSASLVAGIQTPPNVAALGRHLVRVYAMPEFIENNTELTLSAGCPSGGLVTADPGVRSALPYISRVTNVNVWSSVASGDVGQSSLGVHFTNNSSNNELAAFQFVCSVRD